jgi:hypothetical protein
VSISAAVIGIMTVVAANTRAAAADDAPPQAAVCVPQGDSGERVVDPLRLVRWAITTSNLSDQALDTNGDGDTLLSEKQLALTDPAYCDHPDRHCDAADAVAQRQIHQRLATFVRAEDGNYRFERIRRPDPAERDGAPYLSEQLEQPGSSFQVGETLAVPGRYVRVVCVDQPPAAVAEQERAPAARDGAAPGRLPIRTGFRLTGKLEDLGKDRSKLRAIAPAELSISGDLQQNQTTYFVDLFAGYEIELGQDDRTNFSAIPFFQFERRFNRTRTDIDKIGAGGKFLMTTVSERLGSTQFAVSPFYLTDTKGGRQIFTTQFRASPSLPERYGVPIGYAKEFGGLLWELDVDGLAETGRVFRATDTSGPLAPGEFLRTGGHLSLKLQGSEDTPLERLDLDLAYKYLYGITGPLEHFHRFDATLSYLLPGTERYRIGFSYTVGRADDTLQYQDFWSTVLGVRF